MIYIIDGKYYVNISPSIYSEIEAELKGNEVILKPKNIKIETNSAMTISVIGLDQIKEKLQKENIKIKDTKVSKKKNKFYE